MKDLKYYLSALLVFFAISSCNVLDEEPFTQPSTENFYQNETDALAELTASYARLKSVIGYYKQQFMPLYLLHLTKVYLPIYIMNLKEEL